MLLPLISGRGLAPSACRLPAGRQVEPGEPDDPLPRGSLGVQGGVVETEHFSIVIEEFGLLTSRRVRRIRSPSWWPEIADNGIGQNCPKTRPISQYQGEMAS